MRFFHLKIKYFIIYYTQKMITTQDKYLDKLILSSILAINEKIAPFETYMKAQTNILIQLNENMKIMSQKMTESLDYMRQTSVSSKSLKNLNQSLVQQDELKKQRQKELEKNKKKNQQQIKSQRKIEIFKKKPTTEFANRHVRNDLESVQQQKVIQFSTKKIKFNEETQFVKYDDGIQKNFNILQANKIIKNNLLEYSQSNKNQDYKEKEVIIPIEINLQKQISESRLNVWISELYQRLSSQAFIGYYEKKLNFEEMKLFYCQNLILNLNNLIKYSHKSENVINNRETTEVVLKEFETQSNLQLNYLMAKYNKSAQTRLNHQIEEIFQYMDASEDPQFDILNNLEFRFEYDSSGMYDKQIKNMLNRIIELISKNEKEFRVDILNTICIQQNRINLRSNFQNSIINKDSIDQNFSKKSSNNLNDSFSSDSKMKYLRSKVMSKINQEKHYFKDDELNARGIQIKNPEILRILIKWIISLEQKITNPVKHIQDRSYPFISKNYKKIQFSKQDRIRISHQLIKYFQNDNTINFDENLKILRQIQEKIPQFLLRNKDQLNYIKENSLEIGLTSYLLAQTTSIVAINYLNSLIHHIFLFQKSQEKTFYDSDEDKSFEKINYIDFNVEDLLKAECSGTKDEIIKVYQNIKMNDKFKLVRISKSPAGFNEFIINVKYKNTPLICEILLHVIPEKHNQKTKDDCLVDFKHFLFGLKNTKFGILTEAVLNNYQYSENILFFEQKLKKIRDVNERTNKLGLQQEPFLNNDEIQLVNYHKEINTFLYICNNCHQLKYPYSTFLRLYKKKNQLHLHQHFNLQFMNQYICGQCVINSLNGQEKVKFLLGETLSELFEQESLQNIKVSCIISYYIIIEKGFQKKLKFVIKIDDYFTECFGSLRNEYKFYPFDQINIKYIFKIKDILQLNQNPKIILDFSNLHEKNYYILDSKITLDKIKKHAVQVAAIVKRNGDIFILDACKEESYADYEKQKNIYKSNRKILQMMRSKHKNDKLQILDLESWKLEEQFFKRNLKDIKVIKKLNLSGNNLAEITFLQNIQIKEIILDNNLLQKFPIINQNIQKISANKNYLNTINISKFTKLQELLLNHNRFSLIDFENDNLQRLSLENNELDRVVINKLKNLKQVYCNFNKIFEFFIDIKTLEKLHLSHNLLTKLDYKKFVNLKQLYLCFNQFVEFVPTSQMNLLQNIYLNNNQLQKINLFRLTRVKVVNISFNKLTELSLTNQSIQKLDVTNNQLKSLDIRTLRSLKELNINQNKLTQLNVDNHNLIKIFANRNQINKVNIRKLKNLKELNLSGNKLTQICLDNESIQKLSIYSNQLETLQIGQLHKLKVLGLSNNKLKQLCLQNQSIELLNADNNDLIDLDISHLKNIKELDINSNKLKELKLDNQSLQKIFAYNNQITEVNISKLDALIELKLSKNKITNVQLSNQNLEKLSLDSNLLVKLNIEKLIKLKQLRLDNNYLKEFNFDKISENIQILQLNKNLIEKIHYSEARFCYLKSIDLSFNNLHFIDLQKLYFLELQVFKLHNNYITEIQITKKILPKLKILTLGNIANQYSKYIFDKIITQEEKQKIKNFTTNDKLQTLQIMQALKLYPQKPKQLYTTKALLEREDPLIKIDLYV